MRRRPAISISAKPWEAWRPILLIGPWNSTKHDGVVHSVNPHQKLWNARPSYHWLPVNGELCHQPINLRDMPRLNEDVVEWIIENVVGDWHFVFEPQGDRVFNIFFERETDLIFFKLRWS
jgi:hypothetical protein